MIINSLEDYAKYYKDFQWIENRDNEQPSLMLVGVEFQAHFLYFAGHIPEKRQALAECIEEYQKYFGDHLTWCAYEDKEGSWRDNLLDEADTPSLQQIFQMQPDPDDIIQIYYGSHEPLDAVEYAINATTNRKWQGQLLLSSFVQFKVIADDVFDPEKFKIINDLIRFFIKKLGVYHAVSGFQSNTAYMPKNIGDYALEQSKRFLGIYQGASLSETEAINEGIKSIDWITYVNDTLIQRICDVSDFPKYCKLFNLTPERLDDGYIFQLEKYPQLIPSNEPILESYINLNKALRPLRNGAYKAISHYSSNNLNVLDVSNTRLWIRRFDAPDIYPNQKNYAEKNPSQTIYLDSGEKCVIDGIYRYDQDTKVDGTPKHVSYSNRDDYVPNSINDYRQQVVLLKGDLAPRYLDFYDNAVLKEAKKVKWRLVSEIIRVGSL